MRKRLGVFLVTLAFAFSLAGCSSEEAVENRINVDVQGGNAAAQDVIEEVEEVKEEVIPEGMYRSELTNELIPIELKNQRPVAVMVDNEKTALPHYGISQADIVYELMNSTKNDRITRLMVLVKDWESIEQLGSIRSLRPTNILLAVEWNAVICHDGGPFYNDPYMKPDYVENFSGTFSRVKNGKPYEFTEYVLAGDLEKNFASKGYSTEYNQYYPGPHYQFASENNPVDLSRKTDAIKADKVILPFKHNGSYLEYDEVSGLYKYFEYGSAHVDAGNNNQQTAFKNVLIQNCTFHQYDENGYMIFNCIAEGMDGYYLTNGEAIPITWTKRGEPDISITQYFDAEGNEITLNTGKTYIAFVPDDNWDELRIN